MDIVYAITKQVDGPCGHGEPPHPHLCLATDGEWFNLGKPLTIFNTKEGAENFRKGFDKCDFYKVTPLSLV